MRSCLNCKQPIPESRHGSARYCSVKCSAQQNNRKYRERHGPRNDYKRDLQRSMYRAIKYRAKRDGIPFNLTLSDINIPETCPVLGIQLVPGAEGGRCNSPSLDKIDPSAGYTKGNVRVISFRANQLKSNGTLAEMELVLEDLRRLQC